MVVVEQPAVCQSTSPEALWPQAEYSQLVSVQVQKRKGNKNSETVGEKEDGD